MTTLLAILFIAQATPTVIPERPSTYGRDTITWKGERWVMTHERPGAARFVSIDSGSIAVCTPAGWTVAIDRLRLRTSDRLRMR